MKLKSFLQISLTLIFVSAFNTCLFSQSLSPERVAHIKKCTVKVTVEGVGSGTGFLVDNKGTILTCWHVVQPSLMLNNLNQIVGYRKTIVEFYDGKKVEYGISAAEITKSGKVLLSYDVCTIIPAERITLPTDFLKIGSYADLKEGEEVVTCGYPFGITHSFVSRGIISTKFQDTSSLNNNGVIEKIPINLALIDITINKGNSGGAIIKIGHDTITDEVVGIADFIITPVGKDITDLLGNLQKSNNSGGSVSIMGINPNESMAKITQVLTNMSDGISGCVSIEYLQTLIDSTK